MPTVYVWRSRAANQANPNHRLATHFARAFVVGSRSVLRAVNCELLAVAKALAVAVAVVVLVVVGKEDAVVVAAAVVSSA